MITMMLVSTTVPPVCGLLNMEISLFPMAIKLPERGIEILYSILPPGLMSIVTFVFGQDDLAFPTSR